MAATTMGLEYLWLGGTTETANAPIFQGTQTWNNVAVTFTAAKVNITNTASAAESLLLDLQVGTITKFNVRKDGLVSIGLGIDVPEITATDPAANFARIYAKDDGGLTKLAYRDSSGTETVLGAELVKAITIVFDGGGSALTTGVKGDLEIPEACTIQQATLLADQSGSVVVDIWKDTYANYPPTVADTITASAKPTLSSATKSQDSTLTGWTTSIAAGDILRFNIDSATTVTRVTLALKVVTA